MARRGAAGPEDPVDPQLIERLLYFGLLAVCFSTDITRGKIYNACTFPAMLAGLGLAFHRGGWSNGHDCLEGALWGLLVGGFVAIPFYRRGIFGGGTLKLVAALGAIHGYPFVIVAIFYMALAATLFAILEIGLRRLRSQPTEGGSSGDARDAREDRDRPLLRLSPVGLGVYAGGVLAGCMAF